jgi:hypothetical protein
LKRCPPFASGNHRNDGWSIRSLVYINIGQTKFVCALALAVLVSCSTSELARHSDTGRASFDRAQNCLANRTAGNLENGTTSQVSFADTTEDIVTTAQKVIETNLREGAVLDQRWYGLKYFGKHQERIFNATKVIFFGGLEDDVRQHVAARYVSMDPAEENQDSGDIRLYTGKRRDGYLRCHHCRAQRQRSGVENDDSPALSVSICGRENERKVPRQAC